MMLFNVDEYQDWRGNIDDLVETANVALKRFGRGHDADLNVRLLRDYIARGILSPADDRQGKEAIYGFQHLKELMAARVLRSDGWSLRKIAETFDRDRNIVIMVLDPGYDHPRSDEPSAHEEERMESPVETRTSAIDPRSVWKSLSPRSDDEADAVRTQQELQRQLEIRRKLDHDRRMAFERHALTTSHSRSTLHHSMRILGSPGERPTTTQWTRLDLTEWCQVLVEKRRLRKLSLEEAEAIGRAITAALSDPMIRKLSD